MNIKKDEIFGTKQLVELFGSDKVKDSYLKKGKIVNSCKDTLLNKAMMYGDIKDLGDGKYVFNEIYKEQIPLGLVKINKHPIYSQLALLIVNNLIESEHHKEATLVVSLMNYYHVVDIVDKYKYYELKYGGDDVRGKYELNSKNMANFFDITNEKLSYYLEATLNLLKSSYIIVWQKIEMIKTYDKFGFRRATKEEIRFHEDVKSELQNKYKIKPNEFSMIFFNSKLSHVREEYFMELNKNSIQFFYGGYEVYYTDIKRANNFMENNPDFDILNTTKSFTDKLKNSVFESIDNRYFKKIEKNISNDITEFEFLYSSVFPNSSLSYNKIK